MEPIKLEIFMKDLTRAGLRSVAKNIDGVKQNTLSVIALLEKELAEMQAKAKLAAEQGVVSPKQMADIQAMTGMVKGLKEELAELEKQKEAGRGTPVVDDKATAGMDKAGRTADNLRLQFTQVARELPSLALSPQMFILAISNNLPMLTEAIANARKENELLRASGQKAVPVWKQLGKALLSPQTALIVGITLFITHGKEILAWTKKMLGAKEEALSMAEAQKKLNEGYRESTGAVAGQVLAYQKLKDKWKELGADADKQQKFIRTSKGEFEKLGVSVDSVREAENLLIGNTDAFIAALKKRAQAGAADELAKDAYKKYLQAESRGAEEAQREMSLGDVILAGMGTYDAGTMMEDFEKQKEKRIQGYKEEAAVWLANYNSYYDKSRELNRRADEDLKKAGIRKKVTEEPERNTGKSALDYQQELADARIRAQQKLEAARIAVMTEGYKKRKAIARRELDEEIAGIDRTEHETLQKMQEARKKGVKIAPEEEQGVKDTARLNRLLATEKYIKEYYDIEKEWQDKNIQSWIDYNKEYGTYQEKRLAITQEYNLKMQREGLTEGEKAKFAKDRDKAFRELDFGKLKKDMNWERIFGNLSKYTAGELAAVKRQLTAFRNSPEFKSTSNPEQIKIIEDAINSLNETMIDKSGFFGGLEDSLTEYQEAVERVKEAQLELNKALVTGDDAAKEKARENLQNAQNGVYTAQDNVNRSKDKAVKNITAVADAITQLGGAEFSLSQFGSVVGNLVDVLSASGTKLGGLIAAILSILDMVGEKGTLDFAKDLVGNIVNSLKDAVAKDVTQVVKLHTFGLVDLGWGSDKDAERYNELKEKYEALVDIWDELLDRKKEYLSATTADEANRVEEETLELIGKQADAIKKLAQARLEVDNGSHSMWHRMWKGSYKFDGLNWRDVADDIEKGLKEAGLGDAVFNSMSDMTEMSSKQLLWIKENYSGLWSVMDDSFREYMDKLIQYGDQVEEVGKQAQESLTQLSFDSLRDNFLSALTDMDSSTEDFADNFSSYMQRAILNTMLAKTYEGKLQEWYDQFANANRENEGGKSNISTDEYKKLKEDWENMVNQALAERDELKDLFGWEYSSSSSSQSGRSGAVSNITEETGNELVGIGNNMLDKMISFGILLEELKKGREADSAVFAQIADNTAYCKKLAPLLDLFERWEANRFKITM